MVKNPKTSKDSSFVTIPNGTSILIENIGDIHLSYNFELRDVLNVPNFNCNLLPVSRFSNDLNCSLTFLPKTCYIQDLCSRNLIGTGKERGGLYYLESFKECRVAMVTLNKEMICHRILGHASEGVLKRLQQIDVNNCNQFCDSCLRAKQTKLPFPISFSKTIKSFDLIHVDIWGPYQNATINGEHYFLSIVDDYSRGVWVYLMRYKSEVGRLLTSFCNMTKTQFDTRVKRIRTDNGSEFKSIYMIEFYRDQGIILENSCPYTPQQNGVVERKHRHLLEMGRALRFQASLPIEFWGDCILTAAYIINKLPTKVLENRTPHEILLGKIPSYNHLKVFGCLAYVHDNVGNKEKFGERGKPCVFLGYPMGQKGYKFFNLKEEKFYVSRNATFVENIFPFGKDYGSHKDLNETSFAEDLNKIQREVDEWDDQKNAFQEEPITDQTEN